MYKCANCRRSIGLMANAEGEPIRYVCPHGDVLNEPQMPIRRTPTKPNQDRIEEARQGMYT